MPLRIPVLNKATAAKRVLDAFTRTTKLLTVEHCTLLYTCGRIKQILYSEARPRLLP